MTPEGRIKKRVSEVLKEYPETYYFMPVPSGYGESTLDYIGCHYGLFFSVETKRPGLDLTDRQQQIKARMERAEGVVFKISNTDELDRFRSWLKTVKRISSDPDQP